MQYMGERPRRVKKLSPEARYLIATMADTTWRMFVPTIGLLLLGLQIDRTHHSAPWWTLIGLGTGIIMAGLLIREQLNKGKK